MQIYEYARNFMKETGNESQWKNNYPPKDTIMDDIRNGSLYVIKKENAIHAVFAFMIGSEPTYQKISQGSWQSDTEYGTLHRIAGDGKIQRVYLYFFISYSRWAVGNVDDAAFLESVFNDKVLHYFIVIVGIYP